MKMLPIEDYRKLLDAIMSEGLDKIDSLSDESLRQLMLLVGEK